MEIYKDLLNKLKVNTLFVTIFCIILIFHKIFTAHQFDYIFYISLSFITTRAIEFFGLDKWYRLNFGTQANELKNIYENCSDQDKETIKRLQQAKTASLPLNNAGFKTLSSTAEYYTLLNNKTSPMYIKGNTLVNLEKCNLISVTRTIQRGSGNYEIITLNPIIDYYLEKQQRNNSKKQKVKK